MNTPQKVLAAQRREQTFRLKLEGYRQSQIATKLGITGAQVSRIISKVLAEFTINTAEMREEYRALELAKLDAREMEIKKVIRILKRSELHTYLKCQSQLDAIARHRSRLLGLEDRLILAVPVPVSQESMDNLDLAAIAQAAREVRASRQPRIVDKPVMPEEVEAEA